MRRHLLILLVLMGALAGSTAAQEPYDPRQPPSREQVQAAVNTLKAQWKKASARRREELLADVGKYDHPLAARTLAEVARRPDEQTAIAAIGYLGEMSRASAARELAALFKAHKGHGEVLLAALDAAGRLGARECLPAIQKLAREGAAPGETGPARLRERAIHTLGDIPHESSLKILLEIMESLESLEQAKVAPGDSGDMAWTFFYQPARLSFNKIAGTVFDTAAECRDWLRKNPDYKVPDPEAPEEPGRKR